MTATLLDFAPPPSLSARVSKAVCWARGCAFCRCKSADQCWIIEDFDVELTLSCLADQLAGDELVAKLEAAGLDRRQARAAVSVLVSHIRSGV